MVRKTLMQVVACALVVMPCVTATADNDRAADAGISQTGPAWPVAGSLRATIAGWARREGWPAPQFLTDADWPVDVAGSIPGSIENALAVLAQGFGSAAARPRIVISANHVIVVSDMVGDR